MKTLLEEHYNIIVVNRIAEAERKVEKEHFDLILAWTDSLTGSDSSVRRSMNGEPLDKKIPVLLVNPEKLTVELFSHWLNRGMGNYLRHFPVDILKIDKSFVRWMGFDEESDVIVQIIVHLAHVLHMEVIAEGIEEEIHIIKLKELSCEYGQGYFFSKPVDARSAEELLRVAMVWDL